MVTKVFGMEKSLFIVLALIFVVSGDISSNENQNSLTETSQSTSELDQLPGNLPAGIEKLMGLPELNEGDEILRAKCEKNGNNESFDNAMEAKEALGVCLGSLVDVATIKKEINAAKPTGDLDTVFKKYCRKTPTLKGCIQDFIRELSGCLADAEESQMNVLKNVTDSLMNFVCYKEGDRIALFIAEGGPECLTNKTEQIQNCVNSTVSNAHSLHLAQNMAQNSSTEDIPQIAFNEDNCNHFTEVQKCVVQVLEDCSEPTPANIIGSLFDFVRKSTPCTQYLKASGGNSLMFSAMSVLIPLGAIVLTKM